VHSLQLGKHNPRIVAVRKAIRSDALTPDGLLAVEGPKLLEEAVRSRLEVLDVFVRRGVDLTAVPAGARVFELDAATFKTIQSTESSQGIVALVHPPGFSLRDILSVPKPRIVVLGRLQDPGNVGTILRVAESFNATGCVALPGTAAVYNAKTVRASAGSVFRLPHVWNVELNMLDKELKAAGIALVGTSPAAGQSIEAWDWKRPTAILIGNEGGGSSDQELRQCEAVLRVPQNRNVESLNSAIAVAVILYEASQHERISV
jgi:TrmH family RNA methyltransferase